jgi:nucleoside-diphosphate-sugar epimerase
MLVLVTGAAGNLGQSVVSRLLAEGHRVRATDLPSRRNRRVLGSLGPGATTMFGDVTNVDDVARAVKDVDAIAHLAAILPPFSERNPRATHDVNVNGTRLLVDAAVATGRPLPFVLTSSVSTHGPNLGKQGVAGPDTEVVGTDAYSSSKVEAEAIVRASPLAWVVLRVGAAIEGSAAMSDPIVMRLMFEIDPEHPIEIVHGEDVATAVVNAILEPAAHRRVFPIGGGATCRMTQGDLLRESLGMVGVGELPRSAFGSAAYYTCWLDTTESQRVLRFQAHDFEAIRADMKRRFGPFGPLLRVFAPLSRRILLRYSGPHRGEPSRPTWKALIDAGF